MSSEKITAKGLRVYSIKELEEGVSFQRENYGWDFNNEREFIENLFCQRFNFLLVIYSLFITAGASAKSQSMLISVLSVGSILTIMVSLTIWRAYTKLIINLRILHRLPKHAFEYVRNEINAIGPRGLFGVNSIIGLWVPVFCSLSLTSGALLSYFEMIKAG